MIVCPYPDKWNRIYKKLESVWQENGSVGNSPPTPLILTGWNYSNDLDKKVRWSLTIEWAEKRGLENIVKELESEDYYTVEELDTSEPLPLGGYMYPRWDCQPKYKPTDDEVRKAIANLKEDWENLAGRELASITQPLEFTGKKKRRLVVTFQSNTKPPWGSWISLSESRSPKKFTEFRSAINDAIDPVYVDHIDFVEENFS